jgi:hypothetical protein
MTLTLSPYIGAVIAKAKIAPAPLVAKLSGVLALRFMRAAFRMSDFWIPQPTATKTAK